jgi:hypothetical protein
MPMERSGLGLGVGRSAGRTSLSARQRVRRGCCASRRHMSPTLVSVGVPARGRLRLVRAA